MSSVGLRRKQTSGAKSKLTRLSDKLSVVADGAELRVVIAAQVGVLAQAVHSGQTCRRGGGVSR